MEVEGQVAEQGTAILFAIDRHGRLIFGNPAFERYASREEALAECRKMLPDGIPHSFELWSPDRRACHLFEPSWLGETGEPLLITAAIDVTAQKAAEERLRRHEALLVDVQGIAHLGVWEWQLGEEVMSWSPGMYRIYAVSPGEYSPSVAGYLERVHADDRARVRRVIEEAVRSGNPFS